MTYEMFMTLTLSGLSMGVIYALIAMGILILIRAVGVLNFAQGDLLTMGAFASLALYVNMELPIMIAVIVSLIIFALFALVFMFVIYWPLRNAPYPLTVIVATMGLSIIIKETLMRIFGGHARPVPSYLRDSLGEGLKVNILGVTIQTQLVLTIIVGFITILGIFLFFEKMYAGKIMEAASQDKYAAELIGIPTIITITITYILSVSIAGLGGFMVAPIYSATTTLNALQFGAFTGVVIGGWGNIKGTIIGAIIVGLVQSYAYPVFDLYRDAAVFMMMILFLLFRPQGLFKSKIGDKA